MQNSSTWSPRTPCPSEELGLSLRDDDDVVDDDHDDDDDTIENGMLSLTIQAPT